MFKRLYLLAALFLTIGFSANAQGLRASQLLEFCASETSGTNAYALCVGYITGANEGFVWGGLVTTYSLENGATVGDPLFQKVQTALGFCSQSKVSSSDELVVVINYLKAQTDLADQSARGVVIDAMRAAYPCPS